MPPCPMGLVAGGVGGCAAARGRCSPCGEGIWAEAEGAVLPWAEGAWPARLGHVHPAGHAQQGDLL